MSTTSIATGPARATAWTRPLPRLIRRYIDAFCARRIRRNLQTKLEDLSDRELEDIGVTRGDIEYIAQAALSIDPRFPTRITLR
jgi:uncharacterized protein YjiS (DUF1127 family)